MRNPLQRLYALLYFFLVLLLISGCAHSPASDSLTTKGLLWKIESPELTSPSYLFGTMHSEDPRVAAIEGEVKAAFDAAKNFALEVELDRASTQAVTRYMFFNDGQNLQQLLEPAMYQQTQQAMSKFGLPPDRVAIMKPWAVFTVLNMPEPETGEFLDARLYQRAKSQNKTILGLESLDEQIGVFDQMEMKYQIELLRSTLNNQADMDRILDETIEVYLSRDLNSILALNDKYLNLLSPEVAEVFTKRLLTDRNQRMTHRMLPLIKKGDTFVAVGALHLPGKDGIIQQLSALGYKLTPVY